MNNNITSQLSQIINKNKLPNRLNIHKNINSLSQKYIYLQNNIRKFINLSNQKHSTPRT